ncbi:hypothetical protein [Streptomyces sp. NBC_00091]|uniref:hypothetical protein n=1 Tax=Streptomyces sp. NBC_00091 TaxID=2975648 RepID=UPI0022589EC5|nr:hypothetical protein [Streptomyces sp. NBC_00091]MCX5378913.1 hypothetical protein [Streptomyces sp. NBC_00091]
MRRESVVAADAVMAELPEIACQYDRELLLDTSETERVLGVRATALDSVLEEPAPSAPSERP